MQLGKNSIKYPRYFVLACTIESSSNMRMLSSPFSIIFKCVTSFLGRWRDFPQICIVFSQLIQLAKSLNSFLVNALAILMFIICKTILLSIDLFRHLLTAWTSFIFLYLVVFSSHFSLSYLVSSNRNECDRFCQLKFTNICRHTDFKHYKWLVWTFFIIQRRRKKQQCQCWREFCSWLLFSWFNQRI